MRLGAGLGQGATGEQIKQRATLLEAAGVDVVWVPELYSFDAPTTMGFVAAVTDRVEIGSSIMPFYSRTPTLLAMTAAGLDNLSGGRCILGIGSSGPQVIEGWHGVPFDRPVGRTREIIDICRAVWRREEVVHDGRSYTLPLPPDQGLGLGKPLKIINHPVRDRIPIYVASLGPKNVELTAEVAEGWYPTFYWPDKAKEVWGPSIAAGEAKRDPSLPPMETATSVTLAIGENVEHLRENSRPHLALYIGGMGARGHNFYNDLACRYGFEKEAAEIQNLYLDGKRNEAMALVPDALVEGTTLIGPPGYVRERIAAFHEAGVTTLNVNATGPHARAMIEQVREWLP